MRRRQFLTSSLAMSAGLALDPRQSLGQPVSGISRQQSHLILYLMAELAETSSSKLRTMVATLNGSDFNVLVLSFLEARTVNGKLSLFYNGNAVSSFAPRVPALLKQLRAAARVRRRIQISIGGWGNAETFAAIRNVGVPAFVRQLTDEVIYPLDLDGIDLDLEPDKGDLINWINVHREYGNVLVDLTNEYKRIHPEHLVTHAPISPIAAELYLKPSSIPEVRGTLLEATRTSHGNNISWLNIQFYEGGVVEQGTIADFYRKSLAGPLVAIRNQVGVSQPLSFLTPTFQPKSKQPLPFCLQTLAAIDSACADLHSGRVSGVAIWDYQQIQSAIDSWSKELGLALRS